MKIFRALLLLGAIFTFLLTCLFGWLTFSRSQLPYNELGRYYSSADRVVYHQQSVLVYTMVTVFCLFAASALFFTAQKTAQRI